MKHVVCIGLATQDTIFVVAGHPEQDERVVAEAVAVAGGGPAATAAVALARLGIRAYILGSVGDDVAGAAVRAGLDREGVDVSELTVVQGAQSPQSSILVDSTTGSRTIVHYPGTLPHLELSPRALTLCREAEWVHVDHHGYASAPDGVRLSIDGGNPIPGLRLEGVALYAPTEAQLREQLGSPQAALDAGAELLVVTRGERGSVAYRAGGELVEAPPLEVDVVSTLGAGDVFHGALLARLTEGDGLADALRAANVAAALSCRALDGRSAIPTTRELSAHRGGPGVTA